MTGRALNPGERVELFVEGNSCGATTTNELGSWYIDTTECGPGGTSNVERSFTIDGRPARAQGVPSTVPANWLRAAAPNCPICGLYLEPLPGFGAPPEPAFFFAVGLEPGAVVDILAADHLCHPEVASTRNAYLGWWVAVLPTASPCSEPGRALAFRVDGEPVALSRPVIWRSSGRWTFEAVRDAEGALAFNVAAERTD